MFSSFQLIADAVWDKFLVTFKVHDQVLGISFSNCTQFQRVMHMHRNKISHRPITTLSP